MISQSSKKIMTRAIAYGTHVAMFRARGEQIKYSGVEILASLGVRVVTWDMGSAPTFLFLLLILFVRVL